MKKTREPIQRSASLEQNAQQPRLAMEADVTKDTKTRKRTEGAAAAERVISRDNSSTEVDPDPICLTSFGDDSTGLPALPCLRDPGRQRRSGAKVVSLTRGDAQANSRRWLTPRWHSLYSDEDHLSPTAFFLELCRRDQETYLQDINSIRLVLQQFLEVEGLEAKSRQTLAFDPGGCTGRLRACPFWEHCARCFVGSFSLGRWM